MKVAIKKTDVLPLLLLGTGAVVMAASLLVRRRPISFKGASVIITGSRGLALELARQLAREGAYLNLLARDQAELDRAEEELTMGGADVRTYCCDLRNEDEVEHTVAAVHAARGRIDVLINNAGIIQVGPMENMQLEDYREAMAVHAWGPLMLMRAVTPFMKHHRGGRIVNISSIGGLVAVPHLLPYSMSKFALTGLSDGMRAELAKDGIMVTTVAPGLMRTGSHVRAFFKGQHRKEFGWFSISGANPLLSTSAGKAAARIITACRYGKPRLIITWPAALLHTLNANLPTLTSAAMGLAGRLLPGPVRPEGDQLQIGWQCRSRISKSVLTRLSDKAIGPNNEL